MSDVLKGVAGGWTFLVSWVFPAALAWSAFALVAFPHMQTIPLLKEVGSTSASNQALVLLGASILTGLLLSTLSTPLYRVLEGYVAVPASVAAWLRRRQYASWKKLSDDLAQLLSTRKTVTSSSVPDDQIGIGVQIGLARERLRRFPTDPRQFGPTKFSNALRAIETYGWDRYRLDSQTMWSELQAAVPEGLRGESERARAPINFFVSLVYLSIVEALVCLLTAIVGSSGHAALLFLGILALALVPVWYRLAVLNTRFLLAVVQATVNVGRIGLAASMGLAIPSTLAEERDMWERLYWFIAAPFKSEYVADLDDDRRRDAPARSGPPLAREASRARLAIRTRPRR